MSIVFFLPFLLCEHGVYTISINIPPPVLKQSTIALFIFLDSIFCTFSVYILSHRALYIVANMVIDPDSFQSTSLSRQSHHHHLLQLQHC